MGAWNCTSSSQHLCPEARRNEPEGKEGIWGDLLCANPCAVCFHAATETRLCLTQYLAHFKGSKLEAEESVQSPE